MTLRTALLVLLAISCSAAWCQPAIVAGIEPKPVPAGSTALFTLRSADAAWKVVSAGLSVQESPDIRMQLNDSGQSGDKVAGDGVWSFSVPIPTDTEPATYHLVFEAKLEGPQGTQTATTTIEAPVAPPGGASVPIVSPKPGERVSGKVVVKAALNLPMAPSAVTCRIGSSALTTMAQQPDGSWMATVDVSAVSNGPQSLTVCASAPGVSKVRASEEAESETLDLALRWCVDQVVAVANPYLYCWGDLHAHTSYSDGVLAPRDAYAFARDTSKLDFFAVTDHGEVTTAEEMADVIAQADALNKDGGFVALYGVEWTKRLGHICYYMERDPSLSPSLPGFWRQVGEMGVLAHLNHPGMDNFNNLAYDPEADPAIFGVETRDEKEEQAYIGLLDNGWHIAPTGCQDKHDATWGSGPNWTVALARSRTRVGILEALAARRIYSTYDRNMRLALSVNNRDMGSRLSAPAGSFNVIVSVDDPDPDDATSLVQLYLDGKVTFEVKPNAAKHTAAATLNLGPGRHYVFAKITQADGQKAWSAPIWLYLYPAPAP